MIGVSMVLNIVLYSLWACSGEEQSKQFTQWAAIRTQHEEAQLHIEQGDFTAIQILRNLHQENPNSRAILESLLLAELQSNPIDRSEGYQRVQAYMSRHKGDVAIRLVQAKYHLSHGQIESAKSDIQVLLFNQAFHPWVLAQDIFLLQYQDDLKEILPFSRMQVLKMELPQRLLVGETVDFRVELLHLKTCTPSMPSVPLSVSLEPNKLQLYQEIVDDIVSKMTVVLSLTPNSEGLQTSLPIRFHCGKASVGMELSSFSVISLDQQNFVTGGSLSFPSLATLQTQTATTGVPWQQYQNGIPIAEGYWDYQP